MTQEELFRLRQTGAEVQRILDAEGTMAEQAAAAVGAAESANEAAQQVNDALQEIIETGDIPAATVAKVAEHTVQIGNLKALIFDISANNPTEGHPTPYANLAAALGEGGVNVPESMRKGGMSVKFIQSSDNKYVQWRLTANDWSINTEDWAIADEGVYVENPEFVYVKTDNEGKILWAIKKDGNIYYGAGVPRQVIDYVEEKIADLSLDEYEDIVAFLSDYLGSDTTLKTMIDSINDSISRLNSSVSTLNNEKVDKAEGKSLIDSDYASSMSVMENPEYLSVITDNEDKLLEAINGKGEMEVHAPVRIYNDIQVDSFNVTNSIYEYVAKIINSKKIKSNLVLPDYTTSNVLSTWGVFIVDTIEDNGNSILRYSNDLGKTWTLKENTFGSIVHCHIFENGSVLLCTNEKCYYTSDFSTFNESTILDYDGTPFVSPVGRLGFYSEMYKDGVVKYHNTEIEIFGEYILEEGQSPRIWYTTDNGHTVKCAFKSGETTINGNVITIRHFHKVTFCKANGKFYISTGDGPSQCYYIEGTYDETQDSWSYIVLGSGDDFKFGTHFYDDEYAYLITDYTSSNPKKGILRCPIEHLDDFSYYHNIYLTPEEEYGEIALTNIFCDNNGNKVLFPDSKGYGYIWVATNGWNFKKIVLNKDELIGFDYYGPNINGEIFIKAVQRNGTSCQYKLNDIMSLLGVYDFMKADNYGNLFI